LIWGRNGYGHVSITLVNEECLIMAKHPAGDAHRTAAQKHEDAMKAHHKAAEAHEDEQHEDAAEHAESAHLHSTSAHDATAQARQHSQQGQPGYPQTDARGQPLSDQGGGQPGPERRR
jgi:hypothetical protein